MDILKIIGVGKRFTLHQQGGTVIPVLTNIDMVLTEGDAVALAGPSGVGKSTLMRMVYGNYHCPQGQILVRHQPGDGTEWVDVASASPRKVLELRRLTIGYICQFLRVIPRVPTIDIVAEPLRARGVSEDEARDAAAALLTRLNIPESLWSLSPVTFSGGEQQRVNIARGFIAPYPLLLLDEPTASLDAENKAIVIELIRESRSAGAAILGIFHDEATRSSVCTEVYPLQSLKEAS